MSSVKTLQPKLNEEHILYTKCAKNLSRIRKLEFISRGPFSIKVIIYQEYNIIIRSLSHCILSLPLYQYSLDRSEKHLRTVNLRSVIKLTIEFNYANKIKLIFCYKFALFSNIHKMIK